MLQAWQDKQVTSIPVAQPVAPFPRKLLLQSSYCTTTGIDGWITATYAKPRVPVSEKVSCLSAPKGLLCTWKHAQFPAAFLPQVLFSHPTWAEGDQELWHAEAWQHLQVGSEKSKIKLVQRDVMILLYICSLACPVQTQKGQEEDACAT